MPQIRVFEAFAGYGGASFALKKIRANYELVMYSEFDKFARELFEANHGSVPLYGANGDITRGDVLSIPDFELFTGGFPCQPFSSAGLGKGVLDPRGTLFQNIIDVVSAKNPKLVLLENVKGFTQGKHKSTFLEIQRIFREELNYQVHAEVLNTRDYGIPQNRERVWIVCIRKDLDCNFKWPKKRILRKVFHDFLDPQNDLIVPEHYFLNSRQISVLLNKHRMPIREVLEENTSLCLDIYNKKLRKDQVSITLTEPHHNSLRVVELNSFEKRRYTVRKLTIPEHYRLMGFDEGVLNTAGQSYQQLCKRAGNGWDVNVASLILKEMLKCL